LDRVAHELPAPLPLPLAGPLLTGELEEDGDLTDVPGRPVVFDADVEFPVANPPPSKGTRRRRRRRRWSEWLLILVAVTAILGAAGLVAVRLLTPTHAVPSVIHQTEAEARRTLSPLNFHLGVSSAYDDQVAKGLIIRQHPDPGRSRREHSTVSVVVSLGPAPVPVPDLAGLTVDQATQRLAGAGLVIGTSTPRPDSNVNAGQLVSWAGEGGQLPKGSRVDVVVSTGPPTVTVPDVRQAKSFADAAAALQAVGLNAVEDDEFSDTVPKGQIVGTNPAAGNQAPTSSAVTVTVSKGPDLVAVPDVRNMSVDVATKVLEAQGFTVSGVAGAPDRPVFVTNPPAHTLVKRGSAVRLYTS
jgi:serine/threonine-protein kinase